MKLEVSEEFFERLDKLERGNQGIAKAIASLREQVQRVTGDLEEHLQGHPDPGHIAELRAQLDAARLELADALQRAADGLRR